MSQAKVDKYKKEKKNRAKTVKKQRAKKVAGMLVFLAVVGCAIGFPLGKKLYKVSVEHRKATATINTSLYPYWMQQYWDNEYSDFWMSDDTTSSTDATASDATATDADQ